VRRSGRAARTRGRGAEGGTRLRAGDAAGGVRWGCDGVGWTEGTPAGSLEPASNQGKGLGSVGREGMVGGETTRPQPEMPSSAPAARISASVISSCCLI